MQTFVNSPPHILEAQCVWPKEAPIWAEPSLTAHGLVAVYQQKAPLAQCALNFVRTQYQQEICHAEKEGLSAIVDTRTHQLNIGQFPAVPGWHCDGVPRNNYHGQPCFDLINPAAFTVCVCLSTEPNGVSNTQFVSDTIKPKLWDKEHVYRDLHEQVRRIAPCVATIADGQFVKFTPKSIHRATETHRRGWRWWFRFSMCYKPPIENALGNQQQIYIVADENGW